MTNNNINNGFKKLEDAVKVAVKVNELETRAKEQKKVVGLKKELEAAENRLKEAYNLLKVSEEYIDSEECESARKGFNESLNELNDIITSIEIGVVLEGE